MNEKIYSKTELKNKLWEELKVKSELITDGVNITKDALLKGKLKSEAQEQVHCLFEMDHEVHDFDLPSGFDLPLGLSVPFRWNPKADYIIEAEGEKLILTKRGNKLGEIKLHKRPNYYSKFTSDGTSMSTVGTLRPDNNIFIVYSNECSYKDKGQDCLFCNINHTKDVYAEKENIFWKTPKQIGETVAEAIKEGIVKHLTVSGGVVPERRELEYYLDVAEEIKSCTGLQEFNGTATVAAPLDFTNIERFKEAGYRTTAMNIEIWDKNIYNTICPGKASGSGGWDHWLKALEYAVKVFGHGRVRSNIVAGIEPKQKTIEGLEYLASKGIVGTATIWCPNPGSALEGHRSPEAYWYLDLAEKLTTIWRKNGFTYEHLYDSHASSDSLQHDIWRIQDETLPIFKSVENDNYIILN